MRNLSVSGTEEGTVCIKSEELISIFIRMLGTTIEDLATTITVSRDEA